MPPRRDPVPRAREAWVWLGGIMILGFLGAAFVAAAALLWENVDIRQLTPGLDAAGGPLPEPERILVRGVQDGPFPVVLFSSERNRGYFPDRAYYDRELAGWRDLVRDAGGVVREVDDAGGLLAAEVEEVLLLPEAPCLSSAEIAAVRRHLSEGGGVVANWAVGVRNADCAWRGWEALVSLTDAEGVRELTSRKALFLTVPGGVALSPGIDPGTRVELLPDPAVALRTSGPRVYWSDWALNPAPDEEGFGADAAAVTVRAPGGGRVAWFAPRLSQGVTTADSVALRHLLQNGVLWAAGRSHASVAAWPNGARAALAVTLDVEEEPRNALQVAELFETAEIPGSFYAVSQLVESDRELAAALAAVGEVGSQTADHKRLAGLTAQDQATRLRRSLSQIERWTGRRPAGLRPPEDAFDSLTIRAWRSAGGEYILARNDARSASPEVHSTSDGPIVVLPRLLKDDYNVMKQDGAIRAERISETFLSDARKLYAIGGLAVVGGHTQIMDRSARLEAYRRVVTEARSEGDWWIARADEIARWWRSRSEVGVTFAAPAAGGAGAGDETAPPLEEFERVLASDIVVAGPDREGLEAVWVDIVLPLGTEELAPLVDGRPVEFATTAWGMRVPVGALEPGSERRISIVRVPTAVRTAAAGS